MITNEDFEETYQKYKATLDMIHGENLPFLVWKRSPELREKYPNCCDYYDSLSISNEN